MRDSLAALSGIVFLAGTPAVLVTSGHSPSATIAALAVARAPFDPAAVLMGCVIAVVWFAWTWFVLGATWAVTMKSLGASPNRSAARWTAGAPTMFIAAVWACVTATAVTMRHDDLATTASAEAPWGASDLPVAVASSVTGAAAVIEAVGRARNARLSEVNVDATVAPLSRASSLRLAAALAMVEAGSRHVAVDVSGAMPPTADWIMRDVDEADHVVHGVADEHSAPLVVEAARPLIPTILRERTEDSAHIVVRLLGPVEAELPGGVTLSFPRGRSLELLAWLVTHRDRPTRSAARTAMWDTAVQGSTFNNVVSDLRKTLGSADGHLVLDRSPDDRLRLAPCVVSDAEELETALVRFRRAPSEIDHVRAALARVRDLPFAGSGYIWPDTEGITSSLVVLVVRASESLARSALVRDDIDEVFWATGRGLSVLRNHEGLVELRMRAHAARGDSSAVTEEWRLYERVARRDGDLRAGPNRMSALRDQLVG